MYIKGIVDENVLAEVDRRLSNIKAGNIIDSAYLKFYLKEKQVSLFPLIYDTERPDTCAANLFEGRVVIICDGSPFALIAPTTFLHSIHSIEDYYEKAVPASFFRLIRFVSFWLAVFIPGVYLTLILFHSELLPLNFLFTVAGQRVDVPLPGFAEIILMALAFDFLREAGIRMPSALGSSLSFVGAIIIGQAAVAAGIVSAIVVIVVTVTGIASLTLTDYDLNLSVTILRYVFLILAAFLGLFGISIGAIVLFAHLVSLRSFGVPYFIPFAPINWGGFKDSFIRMPLGTLLKSKKDPSKKNPY
jgi:spore germination protein KA